MLYNKQISVYLWDTHETHWLYMQTHTPRTKVQNSENVIFIYIYNVYRNLLLVNALE